MVQCISCESENVKVVGYDCHCNDCGVGWKEPIYKRSLDKNTGPSTFRLISSKIVKRTPWIVLGSAFGFLLTILIIEISSFSIF